MEKCGLSCPHLRNFGFLYLTKRRIMAIAPIWKDYFVTLGKYDVIPFRIRINDLQGDIIYNGKSHIKP